MHNGQRLYEAKLGAEEMGKENHIFSPAYKEGEFDGILSLCGHIVLNSPSQIRKYKERIRRLGKVRESGQSAVFYAEGACYLRSMCSRVQAWDSEGAVKWRVNGRGSKGIHFHYSL